MNESSESFENITQAISLCISKTTDSMLKEQLRDKEFESEQSDDSEWTNSESEALNEDMETILSTVENLKARIRAKGSAEEETKAEVSEIQKKLESANASIGVLRAENHHFLNALSSIISDLNMSEALAGVLEETVKDSQKVHARKIDLGGPRSDLNTLLIAFLEDAEVKLLGEQIRTTIQIRSAYEYAELERIKAGATESQLESAIEVIRAEISESKARLVDMGIESQKVSVMANGMKETMAMRLVGLAEMRMTKSGERAMEIAVRLEEVQSANLDMESELKRIRVRSDQWRNAAEAAADIFSPKNGGAVNLMMSSPSKNESDGGSFDKNGNVFRRIGGLLWRKGSKRSLHYII